jgi:uroporphyrin-III C-methyltransferase / precorrin-2 dehydrogenase / sirohydrochlorin ferrochelatase
MREVSPRRGRPPRIEALAVLPLFADLKDKRVVVAGEGDAAVWKAEVAAAAGARVHVFAPEPNADMLELRSAPSFGSVEIFARQWREEDLCGAAFAIGALGAADASAFAAAARRCGVPVNIVDMPELSDVSFGAVVNRSPVIVAISTGGAAPVLGQAIRAKIETMLPASLGAWAAAAQRLRASINARLPIGAARREVWQRFAEKALGADAAPSADELLQLASDAPLGRGSVALVGAGPGNPELLTFQALRALQSADVILYDHSVSEVVLELSLREARRILVGESAGGPRSQRGDIALMLGLTNRGLRVVWLKSGDPMVFAGAAEELAACRAAGVAVEVVPGITAALGAAAELQIPLVHRDARRLQFITGHGEPDAAEHHWASLADPEATTAFHMAAGSFVEMLPKLIAAGLDPDTPALAAASTTLPHDAREAGSGASWEASSKAGWKASWKAGWKASWKACVVKDLPQLLAGFESAAPMLILIGRTLRLAEVAVR